MRIFRKSLPFQDSGFNSTLQTNNVFGKLPPPWIYRKSCYSTGRVQFFIETFRALGVARGHSVTNLLPPPCLVSATGPSNALVLARKILP